MNRFQNHASWLLILLPILALAGCSGDESNPLSAFEPEIIQNADAFQFQATDVDNVTATLSYTWNNTTTQTTINHSTATNEGDATVQLLDADGASVYTSSLVASSSDQSAAGTAGDWTVIVTLTSFSGTVNFRVEKL